MSDLESQYQAKEIEVKSFVAQKDQIEKEIDDTTQYLTTGPGARFGLAGSLVDTQGFPDKDVELIVAVRQARNQLARLKNDHRSIMATIQEELLNLHALGAAKRKPSPQNGIKPHENVSHERSGGDQAPTQSAEGVGVFVPIAIVDEISSGSPAQEAGLQIGDQIISIGSVGPFVQKDSSALGAMARVVRDSENNAIRVEVFRGNSTKISISLTPKRWSGNGLLGCHLTPT